jgi:hypothetical protein
MSDQPIIAKTRSEERWWQQVDWVGACAFTLALGVSLSMVAVTIPALIGAFIRETPMSQHGAALLSTLFGAAMGAVATFLGQARERQLRNGEKK